ncbi:crotonobetainyl-CoA:carnitine CoA-transferase CaiB-like acyl-CoA transferase [Planomicrobium stackebrandtii]|uniref:Crotonobetainyl-CoA:carnitine CoA-transferase CaiB-like acyl-CoA transferase n=1 Tax=Planomicrobium stackebrandtii TaxID=253160 RepID=A0ABU0GXI3_9BACL|nr:CaiB/BaiF CoA-transferase family protein [Planomicrobium stackebrandtii]MDQ0429639.1 crotonobetainyl-CoA:carnitine CoA-transferase CaiB-like acyl-CoA transferase [Planomicrobium stackebrandtii]
MKDALKGVRILDVTYYVPGPYAGMRLAELGAEVIKIEPPDGDPARYMSGGHVHAANNRGKTIVHIDLKSPEGRLEMMDLVKGADALIETFRPGVMKKLGLDYDSLKTVKPDLVYCSLSGYGQTGEMAELGSHDLNYMALSGALEQLSDDSGRPIHPTNTFADFTGGLIASEQLLAALLKKFRTGKGQYLDIALAEVMAEFLGNHDIYHEAGVSDSGIPEIGGARISYAIYETKDGRYITLGALEDKFWQVFCHFAHRPDWVKWGEKPLGSPEHQEVAAFFKSKDWQEWYGASLQVDACLAPVLKAHERHKHPFFIERNKTKKESDVT